MNKLLRVIGCIAILIWFLYAFHSYLPRLDFAAFQRLFAALGDYIARWALLDGLLASWLWLAAYLWGKKFLQLLNLAPSETERVWLCSAVGLSLLSLMAFVFALLHILNDGPVDAVLGLPVVLWFGEVRRIGSVFCRSISRAAAPRPLSLRTVVHFSLMVFLVVVLGIVLLSAIGPEIEYDPLAIHLAAAKTYASRHYLKAIPDIPHAFFPRNVTLLFSLGMVLHSEITSKVINFLFGILTLLGAYSLGTRLASRSAGLTAACVLASSPLFLWVMRTAHLESGFALFVFLSLYATARWLEEDRPEWFLLAVYATAFSLGTRYQALFSLGSLATVVAIHQFAAQRSFAASISRSVKFFLFSAVGLIPWALANAVQTRNPVFPFLNGIFHSPYWDAFQTQSALGQQTDSGVPVTLSNWWVVATNLWSVSIDQPDFHGNIGVFFLLLIPLLIFQRRISKTIKVILAFSSGYWLFWIFTGQHARYLMAIIPGLAVVAGYALVAWLETLQSKFHISLAIAAGVLLLALAVLNSPFFEPYGASGHYGNATMDSIPWSYLMGEESRDKYLTRRLDEYAATLYFNRLPAPKKLLWWWNTGPRAFYANAESSFDFAPYFDQLLGDNPDSLLALLREHGITHVMVGQEFEAGQMLSNPEKEFVQHHLKKLFQGNATILYEVSPVELQQQTVAYEFLRHIGDAKITMAGTPVADANTNYRNVIDIAGDKRYVLIMHPAMEVEYSLRLPERPLMTFAIGRRWTPCTSRGSFQLTLRDIHGEESTLFGAELDMPNDSAETGWVSEGIDLGAYAGQPVAITFKTVLQGYNCDWFLWADPQILSRP